MSTLDLPGGTGRFDYTALDAGKGLLFLAHMGAGQLVEVDLPHHRVLRTVNDLPDVHGVIVVPEERRVYATVTARNQLLALDEDTAATVFAVPTGAYPDGLAYDPLRHTVWSTNESAGNETVVDAVAGAVVATVPLGGEVGNVVYDPAIDRIVVAVQGRGELAAIDPVSKAVVDRIATPGCDRPHGQVLDNVHQVMFVGCEGNATLVTVDLASRSVVDRLTVGDTPDVLAYDPPRDRVYVASESGWVSIADHDRGHLHARGSAHVATGAHTLALDPVTGQAYLPIADNGHGTPQLWEYRPSAASSR
ncbi:YncE family protein [Mycobacterium aquaticum]|uniref:YncE family protein n=1 Tax=Mycobacterium aquaticum TaxID=1927124 RepID=UPI001B80C686|nr:YncE family protein [Mycobacterium aquaticum]